MPKSITDRLISWSEDVEPQALQQALRTSRLPILAGPLALMADAHYGKGATIGSVLATRRAIVPAAVGVDIGCGLLALRTELVADELPDDLRAVLRRVERAIPAGTGRGHEELDGERNEALAALGLPKGSTIDARQHRRIGEQFASLGSGNHFVEVSIDELGRVWVVLHSGSRGIGNALASRHIEIARRAARAAGLAPEDPDLAWLAEGTPEFRAYVADLRWAQAYACASRAQMGRAALRALYGALGRPEGGPALETVNCHHNYAIEELHDGEKVWITRKGAIRAGTGDRGVVPGSMGSATYIVRGKGSAASYESCAHGAGRRLSRHAARRLLSVGDLGAAMGRRTWLDQHARALLDEAPQAYKDIEEVMDAQSDLVEVEHRLVQVLNYKGT